MFWADVIAEKIIKSGKYKPYWVDDMFTPSGYAHVGSLRGPIIHDLIYRALRNKGVEVTFTYVFNDFDPVDGLPPNLEKKFKKYLGFPLAKTPSPEPGFLSFAHYFSENFKRILQKLGVEAKYLSSFQMYQEGKFNEAIKIALDNAEKIQEIYQRISGSRKKEKGWLPLQVICEKCGKLGTTRVYQWNGKTVKYICEPKMVIWAAGCGYQGEVSPFDGRGKLPWKVDWPAHWKVIGVTIEGAGKDHASQGGSYDIAFGLCEEIFHIEKPYYLPYEHFLLGGKKMSSSKGIGLHAKDLLKILPPSLARFLFVRTHIQQAIEFNPYKTMVIPDLFDEYDRCWQAYNKDFDENLSRIFEYSQIEKSPSKNPSLFLPRFRDIANYLQLPNINLKEKFTQIKKDKLTREEEKILEERIAYAKIWLKNYAPDDYQVKIPKQIPSLITSLTAQQKNYLASVVLILRKEQTAESLQFELYNLAKAQKIEPRQAFSAIYIALLGKTSGPKAAWFLLSQDKEFVIERLKKAAQ